MLLEISLELIFYFVLSFFIVFMIALPIGINTKQEDNTDFNNHGVEHRYQYYFTIKILASSVISLLITILLIIKYG